jgi:hypothetical protein
MQWGGGSYKECCDTAVWLASKERWNHVQQVENVQWRAAAVLDCRVLTWLAGKETEKFAACVKALHGNILEAYLDWCEHVRLPARVPGVQYSSLTSNTRAPVTSCSILRIHMALRVLPRRMLTCGPWRQSACCSGHHCTSMVCSQARHTRGTPFASRRHMAPSDPRW